MPSVPNPAPCTSPWRIQAARIVEELFPVSATSHWDSLLDLRTALLDGVDWNRTLDLFLACRAELEADHYLPFFRLRRLLTASLRLETVIGAGRSEIAPLEDVFRAKLRSMSEIQRALAREIFEHLLELPTPVEIPLEVVERI